MARSKVEIANMALTMIGSSMITSLEDPIKNAIILKQSWNMCRDAVLRTYPWNCARTRITLSPISNERDSSGSLIPAVFGWMYKFQLPSDCIRVLNVFDCSEYRIEGRYLYSNQNIIHLRYIIRLDDTNQYDALLDMALAAYLAHMLCMASTQSQAITNEMWNKYRLFVSEARSIDAQEGGSIEVLEAYDWEISRAGFGPLPKALP